MTRDEIVEAVKLCSFRDCEIECLPELPDKPWKMLSGYDPSDYSYPGTVAVVLTFFVVCADEPTLRSDDFYRRSYKFWRARRSCVLTFEDDIHAVFMRLFVTCSAFMQHEAEELFRVGGKPYHEPHPDKTKAPV